jgi:glycosyltransferase involved in cell wall biosynthesis
MNKIFLTGGDNNNWALDVELKLARYALSTFAEIVDHHSKADFIHTVDVNQTVYDMVASCLMPHVPLIGAINNHPSRLIELPGFIQSARRFVNLIPQSTIAARDMDRLGLPYVGQVSLAADFEAYHPIGANNQKLLAYRREIGIPDNRYVIGLLQRDSDGQDLGRVKVQKGADNFLALMIRLRQEVGENKLHILIGGPRRHWIRNELRRHNLPYTFVGNVVSGDDYPDNVLNHEVMCLLYNILDLYIIPTRWEGAPRQLFDVICCKRKLISTSVGIVPEVLPHECIFDNLENAAKLIAQDMHSGILANYIERNHKLVLEQHSTSVVGEKWKQIYQIIENNCYPRGISSLSRGSNIIKWYHEISKSTILRISNRILEYSKMKTETRNTKICLVENKSSHERLYAKCVTNALTARGYHITDEFDSSSQVVIASNAQVVPDSIALSNAPLIHLIDEHFSCGVECLSENEAQRYEYLQNRAAVSVLASDNCLAYLAKFGQTPGNPVIVRLPPENIGQFRIDSSEKNTGEKQKMIIVSDRMCNDNNAIVDFVKGRFAEELIKTGILDNTEYQTIIVPTLSEEVKAGVSTFTRLAILLPPLSDPLVILTLQSFKLPILAHIKLKQYANLIGMAGLLFSNQEELWTKMTAMLEHHDAYKAAVCLPDFNEAADSLEMVIKQIIYE